MNEDHDILVRIDHDINRTATTYSTECLWKQKMAHYFLRTLTYPPNPTLHITCVSNLAFTSCGFEHGSRVDTNDCKLFLRSEISFHWCYTTKCCYVESILVSQLHSAYVERIKNKPIWFWHHRPDGQHPTCLAKCVHNSHGLDNDSRSIEWYTIAKIEDEIA